MNLDPGKRAAARPRARTARRMRTLLVSSLALLLAAQLGAQQGGRGAKAAESRRIDGITWHRDVAAALKRQRERDARPILWARVLGELEGKT